MGGCCPFNDKIFCSFSIAQNEDGHCEESLYLLMDNDKWANQNEGKNQPRFWLVAASSQRRPARREEATEDIDAIRPERDQLGEHLHLFASNFR